MRNLNSKFYFCLFSDNPENTALASKFEVLDIINHNLKLDEQVFLTKDEINSQDPISETVDTSDIPDSKSYKKIQKDLSGISEVINVERNKKTTDPITSYINSPIQDTIEHDRIHNRFNNNENFTQKNDTENSLHIDFIENADTVGDGNKERGNSYIDTSIGATPAPSNKEMQFINLKHLNREDIKWLTEKNDFIPVFKSGDKGQLRVDMESYKRLRKIEKIQLKGQITGDSLKQVLSNEDAKSCFRILTQDFESSLNFADFDGSMRQLNNIRKKFIFTLINNQRTMSILYMLLLTFHIVVFVFTTLHLFQKDKSGRDIMSPIFLFCFPVVWNLFNSFMFIIYSHPYDIGDRVYIDNDNLIVKDIGLTNTTFERWNNEIVIITNSYIKSKVITNIRRSKNQQWKISFYILSSIDVKTLNKLKTNVKDFVSKNQAFEHISITYDEIKECKFYKMSFIVKHTINHQNGFFMWKVQNKFMVKLVKELNANEVAYIEPELNWNCIDNTENTAT